MDNITDEQRKALFDVKHIYYLVDSDTREVALFWSTLGTKFFVQGRSFDDALNSAKSAIADK